MNYLICNKLTEEINNHVYKIKISISYQRIKIEL